MQTTKPNWDRTKNTLTYSQKSAVCGEISVAIKTDKTEIDDELRAWAEKDLKAHTDHQQSYYDLLLVGPTGAELDFETNIV